MTATNNHTTFPQPRVVIDNLALNKIRHFVAEDSKEISGMCLTRVVGDVFYVDDAWALKQDYQSAGSTDINPEALGKLMHEQFLRDPEGKLGHLNGWWHSHVDMSTFWSGTDMDTIRRQGSNGYCVALVLNKRKEIRVAVSAKVRFPMGDKIVVWDEVPITVDHKIPAETVAKWKEEHEAAKAKHVPQTTLPSVVTTAFGNPSGTGARGNGTHIKNFHVVRTKNMMFWDTSDQGRQFDVDWNAPECKWDQQMQLIRKSDLQIDCETLYMLGVKVGKINRAMRQKGGIEKLLDKHAGPDESIPATPYGSEYVEQDFTPESRVFVEKLKVDTKHDFAKKRDEILRYNEALDHFELWNGISVGADWYMSEQADATRRNNLVAYAKALGVDVPSEAGEEELLLQAQIVEYEQNAAAADEKADVDAASEELWGV